MINLKHIFHVLIQIFDKEINKNAFIHAHKWRSELHSHGGEVVGVN